LENYEQGMSVVYLQRNNLSFCILQGTIIYVVGASIADFYGGYLAAAPTFPLSQVQNQACLNYGMARKSFHGAGPTSERVHLSYMGGGSTVTPSRVSEELTAHPDTIYFTFLAKYLE
jgi:hypothetical protein